MDMNLNKQDYTAVSNVVNQSEKQYLTPYEVSKLIQVSQGTLAVWRTTKRYNIPYVKIGGKVLYPVGSLYSWINSRVVG